jgi:redox-sensitive bicupin YhaK (pirin superfamily)
MIRTGFSDARNTCLLVENNDWPRTDRFIVLVEDWFPAGVFEDHPHRGLETVTYVIEGELDHFDNHGNAVVIGAGDVQWMTAGRGLLHNERPKYGTSVHSLQLWVSLPRADKMVTAHIQSIAGAAAPVRRELGAVLKVFSGSSGGVTSPTTNHIPVTVVEMLLEPNAEIGQDLPGNYNGFIILLTGDVAIGASKTTIEVGQTAWLTRSSEPSVVPMKAGMRGARAVLYAGLPLAEPLEAGGPFVMNTRAEIAEAFRDFQTQGDRFGLLSYCVTNSFA